MRIASQNTDAAILRELGERISRVRIAAGLSQHDLAQLAGVSERTVRGLEAGAGGQLRTLIRVLRPLNLLTALDQLAPEGGPSPIELADLRRGQRRRAPRRRPGERPWQWGDET
jgi:transcriptional regulator with XRE-family HTH domain